MNAKLAISTITGNFPYEYKFKLLRALLEGMSTAMSVMGLVTLFITALLTGLNVSLLTRKIYSKNSIFAGVTSIAGFVSSGCAACGLPILALLGLTGSVLYLPLKGLELPYISILLLLISSYLLLKEDYAYCPIKR